MSARHTCEHCGLQGAEWPSLASVCVHRLTGHLTISTHTPRCEYCLGETYWRRIRWLSPLMVFGVALGVFGYDAWGLALALVAMSARPVWTLARVRSNSFRAGRSEAMAAQGGPPVVQDAVAQDAAPQVHGGQAQQVREPVPGQVCCQRCGRRGYEPCSDIDLLGIIAMGLMPDRKRTDLCPPCRRDEPIWRIRSGSIVALPIFLVLSVYHGEMLLPPLGLVVLTAPLIWGVLRARRSRRRAQVREIALQPGGAVVCETCGIHGFELPGDVAVDAHTHLSRLGRRRAMVCEYCVAARRWRMGRVWLPVVVVGALVLVALLEDPASAGPIRDYWQIYVLSAFMVSGPVVWALANAAFHRACERRDEALSVAAAQ